MTSSFTSMSFKRKEAFGEELSAALGRRTVVSTSLVTEETHVRMLQAGRLSEPMDIDDLQLPSDVEIYTANQDFEADCGDALSLRKGDIVELVDGGPAHNSFFLPKVIMDGERKKTVSLPFTLWKDDVLI